jgi:hypothetical protein
METIRVSALAKRLGCHRNNIYKAIQNGFLITAVKGGVKVVKCDILYDTYCKQYVLKHGEKAIESIAPGELAKELGCDPRRIYRAIYQKKMHTFRDEKGLSRIAKDAAYDAFHLHYRTRQLPKKKKRDTSPKLKDLVAAAHKEGLTVDFKMHQDVPVPITPEIRERIEKLRATQVIAPPIPEFCAALIREALAKRGA